MAGSNKADEMTDINDAPVNCPIQFNRHDLLFVDSACRNFHAECDEDGARIAEWLAVGRPVMVRRPGLAFGGEVVHCGIPLPPCQGKKRLGFIMSRRAIKRRAGLPGLRECMSLLPGPRQAQAEELLESCQEYGLFPEVFGSLAWQRLTGLPYLHETSDIDLRFRVGNNGELNRLSAVLRNQDRLCVSLFDIEVELWNGRAFSWREFINDSKEMMIKTTHNVFLMKKALLTLGNFDDCPLLSERIAYEVESALEEELATYPKPGLVSYVDNGSHKDMNASHFNASNVALRDYFKRVAIAGMRGAGLGELRQLGLAAERQMLEVTGGVNTHRGAIFTLGLLAAAAGYRLGSAKRAERDSSESPMQLPLKSGQLGDIVKALWGKEIMSCKTDAFSHGAEVARRHGCGGARAEAANGFPSVYQCALPAYKAMLKKHGRAAARVHCFFAMLEMVEDTTLLHRGGMEGLEYARKAAREFNRRGGVDAPDWESLAVKTHHEFVKRNLSCGGIADLLAATIFVQRMEECNCSAGIPGRNAC